MDLSFFLLTYFIMLSDFKISKACLYVFPDGLMGTMILLSFNITPIIYFTYTSPSYSVFIRICNIFFFLDVYDVSLVNISSVFFSFPLYINALLWSLTCYLEIPKSVPLYKKFNTNECLGPSVWFEVISNIRSLFVHYFLCFLPQNPATPVGPYICQSRGLPLCLYHYSSAPSAIRLI